jgi:Escherichia/Staphylococcus phage prohead protease
MHREFKAMTDVQPRGEGAFSARVAVTGTVDRFNDRILPGAFRKTLDDWAASGNAIPVLYAHDWSTPAGLLGRVTSAHEDEDGLVIEALLNLKSQSGRNVYDALRDRFLTQFSFAFEAKDYRFVTEGAREIREIVALDLFEVGPCVMGVNPDTELLTVKSRLALDPDPLTLARQLREGLEAEKRAGLAPRPEVLAELRAAIVAMAPPSEIPILPFPVVTPSAPALDLSWVARCAALLPEVSAHGDKDDL